MEPAPHLAGSGLGQVDAQALREARWSVLYQHRERALSLLRRQGFAPPEAEDCVEEAVLHLHSLDSVDPKRAGALLLTTAHRLALNRLRHRDDERRAFSRCGPLALPAPDEIALDNQEAHELLAFLW